MGRNANGEGSIHPWRRGGKPAGYRGMITYTDERGETRRYAAYGRTRAEVRDKLDTARGRLAAGAPVRDAARAVGDWLSHWRATTLAVSDRKESTRALYATMCSKHLEPPPFGAITLDRLRPSDIEALILALRAKGLSDSTVRQLYTILRAGLDGAVRDGLIARNPATVVTRPGVRRREAAHLDAGEVASFLKAAQESRYYPALALIAATGLRRGEALALRWEDVDLDAGVLRVCSTVMRIGKRLVITEPKSAKARRAVPLSPAVVTLLRKHKTAQKAERLRAANQWTDSGLVFTTALGTVVEPHSLLRAARVAAQAAGVDGAGVHTLRHSVAVGWLESGVHIKAVADLLGHSSIAITGDVYGHVSDIAARSAVDGWSGALGL
jgi:integrase